MTDQELSEFREAVQRVDEQYLATPETARRLLIEEGVLTEQGELAEPYR
ncbi:MAG: hypothetical protein ACLGXA_05735 [Acidobacteriota bacterium]